MKPVRVCMRACGAVCTYVNACIQCQPFVSPCRAGVTFVSVHDCFWTHAGDIAIMNKVWLLTI